jgi:cell division septum initiation protein DivIVA
VAKEDFDKLEADHADLKARLAALESRVTGQTRSTTSKPLPTTAPSTKPTKETAKKESAKKSKKGPRR